MNLRERRKNDRTARAADRNILAGVDPVSDQEWQIGASVRRLETIPETLIEPRLCGVIGIDRDRSPHRHPKRTKIIDPVNVVGMRMCEDDAMYLIDFSVDKLRSKIRAGIDEDTRGLPCLIGEALNERCRSGSPVAGL